MKLTGSEETVIVEFTVPGHVFFFRPGFLFQFLPHFLRQIPVGRRQVLGQHDVSPEVLQRFRVLLQQDAELRKLVGADEPAPEG